MKFRAFLIIDEVPVDATDVTGMSREECKTLAVSTFRKNPKNKLWTVTPEKVELEPR